jgi:hypothetical protein
MMVVPFSKLLHSSKLHIFCSLRFRLAATARIFLAASTEWQCARELWHCCCCCCPRLLLWATSHRGALVLGG